METIKYNSKYFNVKDTLECGQIFRFNPYKEGYIVHSQNKCAYCYNSGDYTYIECENDDKEYFYNFFDLGRDYGKIVDKALQSKYEILKRSAELGKGVRILNQDIEETVFSFIVSQNNNIPKIKKSIEKMCLGLGEKKSFLGEEYYAFPTIKKMAEAPLEFYRSISLGYRAEYIKKLAEDIIKGFSLQKLNELSTLELKKELNKLYGIGPKVADCSSLFGYHRLDSFPVDVWIEKVYHEDFQGKLTNRNQITEFFLNEFKENSGYFQQYLFYYKRTLIKEEKLQ